MTRTYLKQLGKSYSDYDGKAVEVCGWVRTIRDSKNFAFIEINDGSFFTSTQLVADASLKDYSLLVSQNVGAGLRVNGVVKVTPNMPQPYEIHVTDFTIEATSSPQYPLQKKRHSVEYLREIAHLRPRTNLFLATFRVR